MIRFPKWIVQKKPTATKESVLQPTKGKRVVVTRTVSTLIEPKQASPIVRYQFAEDNSLTIDFGGNGDLDDVTSPGKRDAMSIAPSSLTSNGGLDFQFEGVGLNE